MTEIVLMREQPNRLLTAREIWQHHVACISEGICPICRVRLHPVLRPPLRDLAECVCCTRLWGVNVLPRYGPAVTTTGGRIEDMRRDFDDDGKPPETPSGGDYCSNCDRWESEA